MCQKRTSILETVSLSASHKANGTAMYKKENRTFQLLYKLIFSGFVLTSLGCFHESETFGLSIENDLLKTAFDRDLRNYKISYEEDSGFFYFSTDDIGKANKLYDKLSSQKEETLVVETECEINKVINKLSPVFPIVSDKEDGEFLLRLYSDDFYQRNLPKELLEARLSCQ